jgi:hypothetical protein
MPGKALPGLSRYSALGGVATSAGRGAQALLRQQRDPSEPRGGVVGQDVAAVSVGHDPHGGGCGPASLCEQRGAVSRGVRDSLWLIAAEELFPAKLPWLGYE